MSEPHETHAARDRREYEEAVAALVDVTTEFSGLAPEDRVYRSPDGYLVKTKILHDAKGELRPSAPGMFHVIGSIVGTDGKALSRADGSVAVHRLNRTWSHHGHGHRFEHPAALQDRQRRKCVLATINEERLRDTLASGVPGIVTLDDYNARKAKEATAEKRRARRAAKA